MKKIKKFLSIFVLILLSIFILSGCKNNTDSPNNQSQKNQQSINKELPENNLSSTDDISTEVIGIAVNGDYILKLKNNTNNDIWIIHIIIVFNYKIRILSEEIFTKLWIHTVFCRLFRNIITLHYSLQT